MKLTLTHFIVVFVLIAGGVGFFVYSKKMEEKAKLEAINGYIANQPVLQLVLKDHPKNAGFFFSHFAHHYEKNGGLPGMEAAMPEMQQAIDQNYLVDHIWYYDEMALRNYLVREYNFLVSMEKNDPKGAVCTAYIKDSMTYKSAAAAAGGDLHKLYMDSSAKLFKSAIPHKLYAIWPGVPGYKEELQKVMMKYVLSLIRLANSDPALIASLQKPGIDGRDCKLAKLMDGALVQLTPPEMSLLWRGMMETARPALDAARKKRGYE
ncbi:MAG: hypothetical protein ACAH80_07935 [Alphaproteobacteria bacterium]